MTDPRIIMLPSPSPFSHTTFEAIMDTKAVLPLPPGMVPSTSREDMTDLKDGGDDEDQRFILKDGILNEGKRIAVVEMETTVPTMSDSTLHAWGSPEASDDDDDMNDGGGGGTRDDDSGSNNTGQKKASPFISSSISQGQKSRPSAHHDRITPKRVMSPLKKFNRVVPSPGNPTILSSKRTLQLKSEEDIPLKSNSASLLGQRNQSSSEKKDRPDSAPIEGGERVVSIPPPIDVKVLVKDSNMISEAEIDGATMPIYATVKKKNVKTVDDKKNNTNREPNIITVSPTLDAYEPEPYLETSLVIHNRINVSPEPHHTSDVIDNDYTVTPDPLYCTVEEADTSETSEVGMVATAYDAALVKKLKKHDDKGNIQLISIKGMAGDLPASTTMNFPQGSSTDLHPLHYAAANGNKKVLTELISSLPISQDAVEMVLGSEKLVKREGIDVFDSEGRTPLMHAVHHNQLQVVKMLADAGSDVNIEAVDGSTSLHQAAYTGSIEMVALLLSLGANGLKRDSEGRTPLHWSTNNSKTKCLEILLDKVPELDIDIQDAARMTSLMWAAFHGCTDHVRVLLEKGADPSIRDMDGMTAIHWSIQRHDTRTLRLLINSESVQYVDKKMKTVMHQAAEQGAAKAVSVIKAVKPTSVNELDENRRTPLHWATVCENPEVIRALLYHGADSSIRDSSDKTALDYALERGMHYCALLISKDEVLEYTDSYHSFVTYGSTSATLGARVLNQQGEILNPSELKAALSQEQILQVQTACNGSWIYKFTNNGKGPLHPRYFWINPSNLKICWAKARDTTNKNTKSECLVGIRTSASPAIYGRKDFDPVDKHKYAFTIFTSNKVLDVVAVSSEDYKFWLSGLQLLLDLGSINVIRLMSMIQNASGADPKPIS